MKSGEVRAEHLALGVLRSDDPDLPDLSEIRGEPARALEDRLRQPAA